MQNKAANFLIALWLVLFCFVASPAFAALDLSEIGVGARSLGMGKTFSSGIDDATAIFTNPAAMTLSPGLDAVSMSGSMLTDASYLLLGASNTSPVGKLGIGYVGASVPSIPLISAEGSGSSYNVVQTGTTDYGSNILFLSYANKASQLLQSNPALDKISFGLNFKLFFQGFSGGGSVMQDATGNGFDADLGILWQAKPWSRLGLTFTNLLPQNMGGKFTWQKNNLEESIPMVIRLGSGMQLLGRTDALWRNPTQKLNWLLDYEMNAETSRPSVFHTGVEYQPIQSLTVRFGIDQQPKATEAGTGVDNNFTAGVGFSVAGFTFDYAYHQFGEISENSSHFFSIGYKELPPAPKKMPRRIDDPTNFFPIATVFPKPALPTFIDLPADFWATKPSQYAVALGIMPGYTDKTFRPSQPVTRAELAEVLIKAKGFDVKKPVGAIFKDVLPENQRAAYVNETVIHQYMSGYADGTFRPDREITRAEAAIIFARFSNLYMTESVSEKVFPDVPKKYWAAPAVAAGKKAGFYEYLSAGDFVPDRPLTRAELAEILSKTPEVKNKIKKFIGGEA